MPTTPNNDEKKLVDSIAVRRVPVFSSPGSAKKFEYNVQIVTLLGNIGTFDVKQEVYEDDDKFALWLQDSILQLDKANLMTGA